MQIHQGKWHKYSAFDNGLRSQNNELMQGEAKVLKKTSDDLNSVKHRNES